jgi:hypothetical protein
VITAPLHELLATDALLSRFEAEWRNNPTMFQVNDITLRNFKIGD